MNRVTIHLGKLADNLATIRGMMGDQRATWTLVTKALCGHMEAITALHTLGVKSVGDSRLENIAAMRSAHPDIECWYLRVPHPSIAAEVVSLADVSLNSELEVLSALNQEAKRQGKIHRTVIMIELGDLREGVLPGSLIKFYQSVLAMPNLNVVGLGAQLGCVSGAVPNLDQLSQLLLYRELLELKFDRKLPLVSAGTSILLPLLQESRVPRGINHFRIGEALFLGSDLIHGGTIPGLHPDAVILEAEVAELKEKSLTATGESGAATPFERLESEELRVPGQRGYRALVAVGQLDTDVGALTPVNPSYRIAGASSDVTVVNVGEEAGELRLGHTISFYPGYSAFVRLMNNPYVRKEITGT